MNALTQTVPKARYLQPALTKVPDSQALAHPGSNYLLRAAFSAILLSASLWGTIEVLRWCWRHLIISE